MYLFIVVGSCDRIKRIEFLSSRRGSGEDVLIVFPLSVEEVCALAESLLDCSLFVTLSLYFIF
jgi:hypothetical protein